MPSKPKKPKKPTLKSILEQYPTADPATAGPEHPLCKECKLHEITYNPFICPPVNPNWSKLLLAIGEGPGSEEEKQREFFVGDAGDILKRELGREGFTRDDVEFRNAVMCRPPKNRTPTMKEVRCCRPFLMWEIDRLDPQMVLALGTTAARSLLNDGSVSVTKVRGRLLSVNRGEDSGPEEEVAPETLSAPQEPDSQEGEE